jgi:hypothetical protein
MILLMRRGHLPIKMDDIKNFNNGRGEIHRTEHRIDALEDNPNRYFTVKEITVTDQQAQNVLNTMDSRWDNRENATYSFADNNMCVNWVDGVLQDSQLGRLNTYITDTDFNLMNTTQTKNLMLGMQNLAQVMKYSFNSQGILGDKAHNIPNAWFLNSVIQVEDAVEDTYNFVEDAISDTYHTISNLLGAVGDGIESVFVYIDTGLDNILGLNVTKSNGVISGKIISETASQSMTAEPFVLLDGSSGDGLMNAIRNSIHFEDHTFQYFKDDGTGNFSHGVGQYIPTGQSFTVQDFNNLKSVNAGYEFIIANESTDGTLDNTSLSSWDHTGALHVIGQVGDSYYVPVKEGETYANADTFVIDNTTIAHLDSTSTVTTSEGTFNAVSFIDSIQEAADAGYDWVARQTKDVVEWVNRTMNQDELINSLKSYLDNNTHIQQLLDGNFDDFLKGFALYVSVQKIVDPLVLAGVQTLLDNGALGNTENCCGLWIKHSVWF